ncbi:Uncharacterised protein [Chlamydia trachomatis]|nr:Uncharacterised protein [Chlamydia trachomatis]
MKVLLGLFSLMRLTFSLHAESKVSRVPKVRKVTRVTKAFKVSKDRKASKVLKVSRASKELKEIKATKATKATLSLGMKFQPQRVKNLKVRKATKATLVILVSITVQPNPKSTKRNLSGLIRQKKNQLLLSTLPTFLDFNKNLILKSNFQPKSQKELNSFQS